MPHLTLLNVILISVIIVQQTTEWSFETVVKLSVPSFLPVKVSVTMLYCHNRFDTIVPPNVQTPETSFNLCTDFTPVDI